MAKYSVLFNRNDCIGCGACTAVSPDFWSMTDDGKSTLKGSKKTGINEEKTIDDKEFSSTKEAAEACPVNVIHITNLSNNQKII